MSAGYTPWQPEHFVDDLFLPELVNANLTIEVNGLQFMAHREFLERVLSTPPGDLPTEPPAKLRNSRQSNTSDRPCTAVDSG